MSNVKQPILLFITVWLRLVARSRMRLWLFRKTTRCVFNSDRVVVFVSRSGDFSFVRNEQLDAG